MIIVDPVGAIEYGIDRRIDVIQRCNKKRNSLYSVETPFGGLVREENQTDDRCNAANYAR